MIITRTAVFAAGIVLSALALQPAAAATLEVVSGPTGARGVNINSYDPLGQSFTAIDSTLTSFAFQFQMSNNVTGAPITFSLIAGEGLTGTVLETQSLTLPTTLPARTGTFYSFDIAPTNVTVGQKYTAVLTSPTNRYGIAFGPEYNTSTGVALGGNAYAGGQALFSTAPYANCAGATSNCDLNFRVTGFTAAASAVPEPANWALMIGGLGVVGGSLRRRRRSSATAFVPA